MSDTTREEPEFSVRASAGPAVDAGGVPVIDPTRNVLDLVAAAIRRQDDLRHSDSDHLKELMRLRAEYDAKLSEAETARIDAIRAVDVQNVQRAAEVATTQATTLAQQVVQSAEALRTQAEVARVQGEARLTAALEPIAKDVAELRRVQYETAGGKAETVERREVDTGHVSRNGLLIAGFVALLSLMALLVSIVSLLLILLR